MILDSDSGCRTNSQNSGRCSSAVDGSGEIMLFGVRVKVDPMRKSVSMNDLSQYVHLQPDRTRESSSNTNHLDNSAAVAADAGNGNGYASADDAVRKSSIASRARKRGVPWTEDEHKLFLLGLEKVGKGDWRGISRNFVKTRTPTQVASHAQKYFLRRSNLNRRRRRSSLFDITTNSVASIPVQAVQEEQVYEDNSDQSARPPILSIENQTEPATFDTRDQIKTRPTCPAPVPLFPTPNLSTMSDNYSNPKHKRDSLSLSLTLNLFDHNNRTDSSAFQAFSGFENREGIITVV